MERSSSLAKKLIGYSALATAMITIQNEKSVGQIIYQDLDPDITIPGYEGAVNLDLNNDSISDFKFVAYHSHWEFGSHGSESDTYYQYAIAQGNNAVSLGVLDAGTTIDQNGDWIDKMEMEWKWLVETFPYSAGHFSGDSGGLWHDVEGIKYMGFRIALYDGKHYGWMRIKDGYKIESYAYQSQPEIFIIAGDSISDCAASFEPNNLISQALELASVEEITAAISTVNDKDWFKIALNSNNPNLRIILSDQPYNYGLRLYFNNSILRKSDQKGKESDTIIINNALPGTYKILVYQRNGKHSPDCYTLIAEKSSTPFKSVAISDDPAEILKLNSYPNPAGDFFHVETSIFNHVPTDLQISNQFGITIFKSAIDNGKLSEGFTVDCSSWLAGIYIAKLNYAGGFVVDKIVVSH